MTQFVKLGLIVINHLALIGDLDKIRGIVSGDYLTITLWNRPADWIGGKVAHLRFSKGFGRSWNYFAQDLNSAYYS